MRKNMPPKNGMTPAHILDSSLQTRSVMQYSFTEFKNLVLKGRQSKVPLDTPFLITEHSKHIQVLCSEKLHPDALVKGIFIPADYLYTQGPNVLALIASKLGLNKTLFARSCHYLQVNKPEAEDFLKRYHLMGATNSGFNRGLFYKNELVALASFSKGRKMNRLLPHQRSYELIRFCSKHGITVTGGLSKLVKNFCNEKNAGDIMTYIDKQMASGQAYQRCGFKVHSHTPAYAYLVNRQTKQREALKQNTLSFDAALYDLRHNEGNIKLVYTPHDHVVQ